MKILHVTNTLQEGGVETFLETLLPGIRHAGHQVEVLVLTKGKDRLAEQFEKVGIKVFRGKFRWVYNPLNIFVIWYYIRQYDIIHVHLFPTQYFAAVARLFRPRRIKFVTTEHSAYNKRRSRRYLRLLECQVYMRYDRIVTVSHEAKASLDQWVGMAGKTSVIYNGIALKVFQDAEAFSKHEFGWPANVKVVMMIARFFPQKDHVTPIKAMLYLPEEVHLVYVGSGETLEEHKQIAQSLHLEGRVHFLGNRTDIPRLAKMCDVGLLASNFEGFGLSTLEVMAAGKPVVVSDIDGVRELVQNYGLLFRNYDEHDLAGQIKKLLDDKSYYDEIAVKCRKRSEFFSSAKMIGQYLELYRLLL